jgi:hypothetical protein
MGDGHDCSCAEPQILETHDRIVCAECGGTVRKEHKDGERTQRDDPGQGGDPS